jgi:Trk K+ transport system NAD-binding subunit
MILYKKIEFMEKNNKKSKISYFINNYVNKGTSNLMLLLFIVLFVLISIISFFAYAADGFAGNYFYVLWQFLNLTFDAGNLMEIDESRGATYIGLGFLITLLGLFAMASVISFVNNGFTEKVKKISNGRGQVLEKDFTLILGYDRTVAIIVQELIIANINQKKGVIVILSSLLPEEVLNDLGHIIKDFKNTQIIVRSGNYLLTDDLEMCSIEDAKSIIIINKNDVESIKTLITINQSKYGINKKGHIVTYIDTEKYANMAKKIIPERVFVVYVHELRARIFARTCLQPGSSQVYKDLFSFDGSELYFEKLNGSLEKLIGLKFSDAVLSINNGYLIGISRNRKQLVNPEHSIILDKDDELIVVSEDDGLVSYADNADKFGAIKRSEPLKFSKKISLLIIGYNKSLNKILHEFDTYNYEKDKLTIMVQSDAEKTDLEKQIKKNYQNQDINPGRFNKVSIVIGNGTEEEDLESLEINEYEVVCVFASNQINKRNEEDFDAETMVTIMNIHSLEEKLDFKINIVAEILSDKNVLIFENINIDDFLVSNFLVARILAQISENPKIQDVIEDLVSEEGSEIYMKNATDYFPVATEITCYSMLEEAIKKHHLFVGYKLYKQQPVFNPPLDSKVAFGPKDYIIVVSED